MALMRLIETIECNISDIPIIPGQIIFCTDTRDIYMDDSNSTRTPMTDIIKIPTEEFRESIFVPLIGKIYLVEETNILYTYNGSEWENITLNIKIGEESNIKPSELVPGTLEKKGKGIAPRTLASLVYMEDGNNILDIINKLLASSNNNSLAIYKSTTSISTSENTININIPEFDKDNDSIFIYLNSTYIEENQDYIILDNNTIQKSSGSWDGTEEIQTFNFIVYKNVFKEYNGVIDATNIKDNTILESKLSPELQNKINGHEQTITLLQQKIEQLEKSAFIIANV